MRIAERRDLDQVVDILAAAFAADPVVRWVIGAERVNSARLRHFFRAIVGQHSLVLGGCDLTAHGAAAWVPPGQTFPSRVQQLRQLPGLVRAFGPRLMASAEADQLMRSHHPDVPHWYLQFVGVEPSYTGQGIGSSLLKYRLDQIDAHPAPAYLESSQKANLPLYLRHGFEISEELRFTPEAPLEYLMWRPAAS